MPTKNPRVAVTLPPSLDLLVGRMALYARTSKSSVLRELLETAEPALQRTVALMEAAHGAAGAMKARLATQLDATIADSEATMARLLGQLDEATSDLVRQAEAIPERRPAPGGLPRSGRVPATVGARVNPPASNRGVKSPRHSENRGKSAAPRKSRGSR
jgi:hypothetical protein